MKRRFQNRAEPGAEPPSVDSIPHNRGVAERQTRQSQELVGIARAGSNPAAPTIANQAPLGPFSCRSEAFAAVFVSHGGGFKAAMHRGIVDAMSDARDYVAEHGDSPIGGDGDLVAPGASLRVDIGDDLVPRITVRGTSIAKRKDGR